MEKGALGERVFADAFKAWADFPTPRPPEKVPVTVVPPEEVRDPAPSPRPVTTVRVTSSPKPAHPPAENSKLTDRGGWIIQVGAYPTEQAAKERLSSAHSKASEILTGAEAFTETIEKGGTTY